MQKTELSKILSKKRIELGITQAQMAKTLGTSSSFLSSVELSKSKLPLHLLEKMIEKFEFSGCEMDILIRCYVIGMVRLPDFLNTTEKNNIIDTVTNNIFDGFIRCEREKG